MFTPDFHKDLLTHRLISSSFWFRPRYSARVAVVTQYLYLGLVTSNQYVYVIAASSIKSHHSLLCNLTALLLMLLLHPALTSTGEIDDMFYTYGEKVPLR